MRIVPVIAVVMIFFIGIGCESVDRQALLQEQVKTLTEEKGRLQGRVGQLETQVRVLATLPEDARLESLYELQRVKIGRYTNLFDKDKDGKKETLIVYLKPIDKTGDIVKAAGSVDVELWDLNRPREHALLGQWQVGPAELKELWYATIVTINYRLTFDVADKIGSFDKSLIVKVVFTDHLAGKVFKEQKVITP